MIRLIGGLAVLLSPLLLSGCVAVVAGAGGSAGVTAAQERSMGDAWDDTLIETQIRNAWLQEELPNVGNLEISSIEGRVLLTGRLQDPDHRVEAVRLAWQVEGVAQVINEIEVAEGEGVGGFLRDRRISTQLRGSLAVAEDIRSINYSIDTVGGVVYLMGIARDQAELDRVFTRAREIKGVERVVSYVRIAVPATDPDATDNAAP